MKQILVIILLLTLPLPAAAQKAVYIPSSIKSMDLNSTSSKWCHARSRQSENVAVFWETGFGADPAAASGSYRVDIDALLSVAEKSYAMYLDTLKFAVRGSSVTDNYKLMIFLLYTTEWTANGSGEDETVGSLRVNPAAANINVVVAHEMGHCFQYITGCDGDGGYRYGFGANGSGGNGFWEQCANWMAFKTYPERQFTESDFSSYLKTTHLHIIHETPRYANYFLPDYWTYKHDRAFMGKLWRDSRSPEDPVETYKRLNSLTQTQFNDEMYEHAARLTTWDLPAIRSFGEKYIDSRAQVKMSLTADNCWLIDPSVCPENYGYNCIKLNVPAQAAEVAVRFKGKAGASGFRALKTDLGGWRFGFVALLKDNTRKYGAMETANSTAGNNPDTSLTFSCPGNCSKLWLVVSGAPQEHWHHAWDDNDANDEQWPYQVQFTNTNLLGQATGTFAFRGKVTTNQSAPRLRNNLLILPDATAWRISDLRGRQLSYGSGKTVDITTLPAGGYVATSSGRHFAVVKR